MTDASENTAGSGDADRLFAELLERHGPDDDGAFERLVAEHAELAAELRVLAGACTRPTQAGGSWFARAGRVQDEVDAGGAGDARAALGPGDVVGDYRLVRKLGQGGMGQVWEAEERSLRRRVALKLLLDGPTSERALAFFEREGRAGARLRHPGIVAVYAAGEADGVRYIATELVEGNRTLAASFAALRAEAKLEDAYYRDVARLFIELADALGAAHEAGVVHRDVKPANVLIAPDGRPRVTDFGVARILGEQSLSQVGDLAGTAAYMSPEQASMKVVAIDHRTDIFSLGVVLYEALTLQRPFEGDTTHQVLRKILLEDPPDPRSIRSRVPLDLALVCGKAMEKDRERRYPTMGELAADLERWLANEPIEARPAGIVRRARKWVARHPTWSAVGALALVAISGLSWMFGKVAQASAGLRQLNAMSAYRELDGLQAEALDLWPALPENVGLLEDWCARAERLIASLDTGSETGEMGHRERLESLVRRAGASPEDLTLERIDELEVREGTWWVRQLFVLVRDIEAFGDAATGLAGSGVAPPFGWGVARRLAQARRLAERMESAAWREPWGSAIAAIADRDAFPEYGGLELAEQPALLPLGPDPASGFWELVDVLTGDPPERNEDGALVLTEESGVVFVLLPGGPFTRGAQNRDETGLNYDPDAQPDEFLAQVELAHFFISKYELTQAQWLRLTGENPSEFHDPMPAFGVTSKLHPVERVRWQDAVEVLSRFGMQLPTEAQWEYAARAGTPSPWWTGPEKESLAEQAAANVADRSAIGRTQWPSIQEWLDDRFFVHAPVHTFAPNPFGLHHVHGNVYEWCADWLGGTPAPLDPGTGLQQVRDEHKTSRVMRGGSFQHDHLSARCANRGPVDEAATFGGLGVRPVRLLSR